MTDAALCDVPSCPETWIFVEHREKIPIRRRCHHHWFEPLKLVPKEDLRIVREVTR